jgi:hypothetical protein
MWELRNTIRNPRQNRNCPALIQNGHFLMYQPTPWRQALLEKKAAVPLLKILWNQNVYKKPPLAPNLGQINPAQ